MVTPDPDLAGDHASVSVGRAEHLAKVVVLSDLWPFSELPTSCPVNSDIHCANDGGWVRIGQWPPQTEILMTL